MLFLLLYTDRMWERKCDGNKVLMHFINRIERTARGRFSPFSSCTSVRGCEGKVWRNRLTEKVIQIPINIPLLG